MSHYRGANLAMHSFCNLKNPNITTLLKGAPTFSSSALESNPSLLKRFGVGRRYYNAENQGWFQKSRNVVERLWSYVVNLEKNLEETVLYTKRTRYVLFPTTMDKKLGDNISIFAKEVVPIFAKELKEVHLSIILPKTLAKQVKNVHSSLILPETHPQCVRLRWILGDIVQALHKGVKKETSNATTKHLDGLNWEIWIFDLPIVNALSFPGGKIILFQGILQVCPTDTEVATIIGHEVAHVIARHWAERLTKKMCNPIIKLDCLIQLAFFSYFVRRPDVVNRITRLLEELPLFKQQQEAEADYIGLILVASAGYNPLLVPKVFEKLKPFCDKNRALKLFHTHPSIEMRVQLLVQVMQEAVDVYQEVEAGHLIQPREEGGLRLVCRL